MILKRQGKDRLQRTKLLFEKSFCELEDVKKNIRAQNVILIFGHIASFDKGSCSYLNCLAEHMPDYQFVLLSETPRLKEDNIKKIFLGEIAILHRAAINRGYDPYLCVDLDEESKHILDNNIFLSAAIVNLYARFPDMAQGYPEFLISYYYKYLKKALDIFEPQKVIIWNKFSATHDVMCHLCGLYKIQPVFMEFGVLPGTFSLETYGQMGESEVAIKYDEFLKKSVSEEEIKKAQEIINYIYESRLNRNIQPKNNELKKVYSRIIKGSPVITYFGQNDFESGLFPYNQTTRNLHSPIYKSSIEPLQDLAVFQEKYGWNVIFKPHPSMINYSNKETVPKNIIIAHDVDIHDLIDLSDVVITILSQCSYEALIRETPVIMLGYNQLKGKGCTYEAFERTRFEETLIEAVKSGLTETQKKAFAFHVAQLLKYYLYDDNINRRMRYGKTIEECLQFIKN